MTETPRHKLPDDGFTYDLFDIFQELSENENYHLELKRKIIAAGEELLDLLRSCRLDLRLNAYEVHYHDGL